LKRIAMSRLRKPTVLLASALGFASLAAVAAPAATAATVAQTPATSAHQAPVQQAAPQAEAAAAAVQPFAKAAPTVPNSPAALKALAKSMVPASQWASFNKIVSHESSWNFHATNKSSGAYGLVQALPGSKMASAGSDWRTNPATQIKWGLKYMNDRYGSPNAAWAFWQTHHWY